MLVYNKIHHIYIIAERYTCKPLYTKKKDMLYFSKEYISYIGKEQVQFADNIKGLTKAELFLELI